VGHGYFENMLGYEWELTRARWWQHGPHKKPGRRGTARTGSRSVEGATLRLMATTDIALTVDVSTRNVSKRFYEHPDEVGRRVRSGAWYTLMQP